MLSTVNEKNNAGSSSSSDLESTSGFNLNLEKEKNKSRNRENSNGEIMSSINDSYISRIAREEVFKPFLLQEFNEKTYISQVLKEKNLNPVLTQLRSCLQTLDSELMQQVFDNHDDLLKQATGVQKLEDVLEMIRGRVESLHTSMERLRDRIEEPYSRMQQQIKQLSHIQETCEILRSVIRYMQLTDRLSAQLKGDNQDLPKGAQCISELQDISVKEVIGIKVVDSEHAWIEQEKRNVIQKATHLLNSGLNSHNHTDIATSLQVFFNLGLLEHHFQTAVDNNRVTTIQLIDQTFSPSLYEKGTNSLWDNIELLFAQICESYAKIFHLEYVIKKKRDANTQKSFFSIIFKDGKQLSLLQTFWEAINNALIDKAMNCVGKSSYVKLAFEDSYPKLLRTFNDLKDRITSVNRNAQNLTFPLLTRFEGVYLSRSVSRINESATSITLSISKGNQADSSSFNRLLISELQVSTLDAELLQRVARNVSKGIRIFLTKIQTMIINDRDGFKVIQIPSQAQLKTIEMVNILNNLKATLLSAMDRMPNLSGRAQEAVTNALNEVKTSIDGVLKNQFDASLFRIKSSLLRMHEEDFSKVTNTSWFGTSESTKSLYMTDLIECIENHENSLLSHYEISLLSSWREMLVKESTIAFVRLISLIRPISENGKLRIADDIVKFESAMLPLLSPISKRLSDMGSTYKMMRAFKLLLFIELEKIQENTQITQQLSLIDIIHHLYSRSPSSMLSPHTRRQWSIPRYYDWISTHSTKDVLKLIQENLGAYTREIHTRGEKEFDPVYPVIIQLLESK